MKKVYSGVGSRETPSPVLNVMSYLSNLLCNNGWILRSGGAPGADSAFEEGIPVNSLSKDNLEIYLPWAGFKGATVTDYRHVTVCMEAMKIASTIHPYWHNLKDTTKKLMARNAYQVLGKDLKSPSDLLICWTRDGCEHHSKYSPETTGGTGLAIALASKHGIPIYNLGNKSRIDQLLVHLEQLGVKT